MIKTANQIAPARISAFREVTFPRKKQIKIINKKLSIGKKGQKGTG